MYNQSIKDRVYEGILNDIMDGVYDVKSRILEKDIIEKYQVSKTPVREALVLLCGEGILRNVPRYGYQLVAVTPQQILEVIEFRKIIEIGALTSCFFDITEENIKELQDFVRKTKEIEEIHNSKIHWKYNLEFHEMLCGFCENGYLQKSLKDAMRICTGIANQYYTMAWSRDTENRSDMHQTLIRAIQEKDLAGAVDILEKDIEHFKSEIL